MHTMKKSKSIILLHIGDARSNETIQSTNIQTPI